MLTTSQLKLHLLGTYLHRYENAAKSHFETELLCFNSELIKKKKKVRNRGGYSCIYIIKLHLLLLLQRSERVLSLTGTNPTSADF